MIHSFQPISYFAFLLFPQQVKTNFDNTASQHCNDGYSTASSQKKKSERASTKHVEIYYYPEGANEQN